MGRQKGLRLRRRYSGLLINLILLLTVTCEANQESASCASSRCGKINNIRRPFRLRDDPPSCGDERYELSCENNQTVLYLYSGRYYVLGIHYNNYTIRIMDPGIQDGTNCSSLPLYFLSRSNFSDNYISDATNGDPYRAFNPAATIKTIFQHVVYLNCSDPVYSNSWYVDTASCVNWHSGGHIYATPGEFLEAGMLEVECRVKFVAAISLDWVSLTGNETMSYGEIHGVMTRGFELSWWPGACADNDSCLIDDCVFDYQTQKVGCRPYFTCITPLGYEMESCGIVPTLRIFIEDYLYGIVKGYYQIRGKHVWGPYTDYNVSLSQFGVDMGVVTVRYFLPIISIRFLLGVIFLSILLIDTCRRRHLSMYEDIEQFLKLHNLTPVRYSYKELKMMTKGFKTKLGEGGFGTVYQGKLRSGPLVAIKMLGKSKENGKDFISEVATIGRIHHFNVVHLIGFCVEGSKRALVYEFMPNGSLDKYIFFKEGSVPLDYDRIYEISLGVARGIAYLHHGCDMQILHFDIKPHNILLDDNFTPKISDFGLAKLYSVDDSIVPLTAAQGTIGYMAPELFYRNMGGVSYKADVYSFGKLLMEMASKRKNCIQHEEDSNENYFPFWIYDQLREDQNHDIEILESLTEEEKKLVKKMFIVALWCIQWKPNDRPSMNKVVDMLEGGVESLEMPPKPSWYQHEVVAQNDRSNYDQTASSYDSIDDRSNYDQIASSYDSIGDRSNHDQTSSIDSIYTSSNSREIASDDE